MKEDKEKMKIKGKRRRKTKNRMGAEAEGPQTHPFSSIVTAYGYIPNPPEACVFEWRAGRTGEGRNWRSERGG